MKYEYDTLNYDVQLWKNKYHDVCKQIINSETVEDGADTKDRRPYLIVPREMKEKHPCLVYLIMVAKSMDAEEKQSWCNLYDAMSEEHIDKLYLILYKERYKLLEIKKKYSK